MEQSKTPKLTQKAKKFVTEWADKIEKKPVEWLWKKWIPRGTLSIMTGEPQSGKSTIICELVARLSRQELLPGEEPGDRHMVERSWIMSSEDKAADTITWRLENQGADLRQVLITDTRRTLQGETLKEMEEVIRENSISFVVIDTMTTWMGGDLDMNRTNESMDWTDKIGNIAYRTGATILLVRHRRKGGPNDNKLHAGLGTIGFTAAVRSELMASVRKKDNQRILEKSKGNVGKPPLSLGYEIIENPDPENPHGILRWQGEWVADEEITPRRPRNSKTPKALALAIEWLRVRLSQGPVEAETIYREAAQRGLAESTLKRARNGIADTIEIEKGKWVWSLKPTAP